MEGKIVLMVALALFAVVAAAPLAQATCTQGEIRTECVKSQVGPSPCDVFVPPRCGPPAW